MLLPFFSCPSIARARCKFLSGNIFVPGDHGSTFGGNYLSTISALEVCNILDDLKNSGTLDETIIYFENKLKTFYETNLDIFDSIVGLGFMRGLRVKSADILSSIITESFNNGVLVLKAGKNTLRFLPPLTITKDEIDEGFKRLERAIEKIK